MSQQPLLGHDTHFEKKPRELRLFIDSSGQNLSGISAPQIIGAARAVSEAHGARQQRLTQTAATAVAAFVTSPANDVSKSA